MSCSLHWLYQACVCVQCKGETFHWIKSDCSDSNKTPCWLFRTEMQDSPNHLFKLKLRPPKLGFFYLLVITLFLSSCLIYLFHFYTSVTLLPDLFTSFFHFTYLVIPYILCFLIKFCLFFLLFQFPFFPSFCHAFLYIPYSFFPISLAVSFHSFFAFFLLAFFLFFGHFYSLFMFY